MRKNQKTMAHACPCGEKKTWKAQLKKQATSFHHLGSNCTCHLHEQNSETVNVVMLGTWGQNQMAHGDHCGGLCGSHYNRNGTRWRMKGHKTDRWGWGVGCPHVRWGSENPSPGVLIWAHFFENWMTTVGTGRCWGPSFLPLGPLRVFFWSWSRTRFFLIYIFLSDSDNAFRSWLLRRNRTNMAK